MHFTNSLPIALLMLCICSAQAQTLHLKSGPFQTPALELYTSEGCSSCPPADRWLGEVIKLPAQQLDVLALAFHVDYWDYIGWKDPFASAQFTDRQRRLARANGQSSIYTPEFFLNDIETRGRRNILDRIRQSNRIKSPLQVELTVDKQATSIDLQLNILSAVDDALMVEFVVFENNLSSQVKAGENAGSQLNHQQVVRYLSPPLSLSTQIRHQIQINPQWVAQNLGIAAIVRSSDNGFLESLFGRL